MGITHSEKVWVQEGMGTKYGARYGNKVWKQGMGTRYGSKMSHYLKGVKKKRLRSLDTFQNLSMIMKHILFKLNR